MSSLNYYSSIFTAEQLAKLRHRNIITIMDFLQESPESLSKMMNLRFKEILEMKEKLVRLFKGSFNTGLQLHSKKFHVLKNLPCRASTIEQFLAEFESSTVYELCGLSGSGKTQVCLGISACIALAGHKVHYIDTKNDFSASRVFQIISHRNAREKDVACCLNRITVTNANNLYQLINVLHGLKTHSADEPVPFIIVDCLSTLYFTTIGLSDNTGSGLLNHIASIIKFLKTEFHTTFILTNLAAKYATNAENVSNDKKIKPCLGNYWSQACDTRIVIRKIMNSVNISTIEKDNCEFNLDLSFS